MTREEKAAALKAARAAEAGYNDLARRLVAANEQIAKCMEYIHDLERWTGELEEEKETLRLRYVDLLATLEPPPPPEPHSDPYRLGQ